MPAHVLVVLNPTANSGRSLRMRDRIEDILRSRHVDFELRRTRAPGHAVDLAREAAESGVESVVAVGGDGTVHEVVRGLLGAGSSDPEGPIHIPSLVVVPVGTGNDFFRMLGGARDPDAALRVLQGGRRTHVDVGLASWEGGSRLFVNLLGVGVDVEVLRRREAYRRLPGLAQYLTALLDAILRYEPYSVRIHLDECEEIVGSTQLTVITVGPSAGGGFLLNPDAVPDDGKLDLCFIEALSLLQVARYLPRIVRGAHRDLEISRLRTFQRARIERSDGRPMPFQLDGELMEAAVPWIDVEVLEKRLPVLVPGDRTSP